MTSWHDLLAALASGPRENGSIELQHTALWLQETLRNAGVDVEIFRYTAYPYRLRLAGVVALLGTLLYFWSLRARRPLLALLVALAIPTLLLAELDFQIPLFGRIGATEQMHVLGRIPVPHPTQRFIFAAHYDSKTDLLDHVERAPIELLGIPVTLLMIAGALLALRMRRQGRRSRWTRIAAVTAVVYGVAMFIALSGGAFVSARSHGALDDGAACAALVHVAEQLAAEHSLQHTNVEVLFLSGEEAGVQGSWAYASQRFAERPALPTKVVNLEFIGASPDLAVFGRESFSLRSYEPDDELVGLLDRLHRERRGQPLYRTWYGAGTDARSFLAHGIPAATLISDLPGHALARHLHSAADDLSRVDESALASTADYLIAVATAYDRR